MARNSAGAAGAAAIAGLLALALFLTAGGAGRPSSHAVSRDLALTHLPGSLAFEPNAGRVGRDIDYLVNGRGSTLALSPTGARLTVGRGGDALTTRLVGAAAARARGENMLRGKVNWYATPDKKQWRTGLPTFGQVRYSSVYPGIDLVYHGKTGALEYDFVVAPHTSPAPIAMELGGARSLRLDANGNLVARVGSQTVRQLRPVAYQRVGGERRKVSASFVLEGNRLGFRLGSYDRSRPLVIDPVLAYSDYFGGAGSDGALDVAIDSGHNVVIAGYNSAGGMVAKIGPDGTRLWTTNIGRQVAGVAVDGSDNIVIAGYSWGELATTPGADQPTYANGNVDGFAAKLAPDGSRAWATYLGTTSSDVANGVAVDRSGAAYVVGRSSGTGTAIYKAPGFQTANAGSDDGFLVKYSPSGARLYGTYMGGTSSDQAYAVAVAPSCVSNCPVFVTGYSWGGFPTTGGTDRPTHGAGTQDAFVIRVNATGGKDWATYAPYTGPAAGESATGHGIAVSPAGNPTVVGGFDPATGTTRAFVTTFIAGSGLRGPDPGDTLFPTTADGYAHDVAYDAQGNVYIIGETGSTTLATTAPVQADAGGIRDAFAIKLGGNRNAAFPIWVTYLGGSQTDYGYGVAADSNGGVYLVGSTYSNNFPTANAKQPDVSTAPDAFITRIEVKPPTINTGPTGTSRSHDAAFTYAAGESGGTYRCRLSPAEASFSTCPGSGKSYSGVGDGEYTFEVQSLDIGGTPSPSASQKFTVDTKPVAAFTIAPNPVLVGRTATFDASTSASGDGAITKYEWDLDGDGTFEKDAGTSPTTTSIYNAPTTLTVSLRITNAAGVSGTTSSELRVTNLSGPSQFGVTINKGAQFTRTPNVVVSANFPANTTSLLFSNDGGFLAPTTFTPAKDIKWKLDSSGPERLPKTIYVRFLNGLFVSETHQDDIILDEVPPKVDTATVEGTAPAASVASASRLRKYVIKVKARDSNSGVSKVQVTATKKKPGKALAYKRKLTVKATTRPVWLRARDRAGNWSKWKKLAKPRNRR